MNAETIAHVQQSWAQVQPIAAQAAALFYRTLFEMDPQLQPLFKGNLTQQGRQLMLMIGAAVDRLSAPQTLIPVLQDLGRRHRGYGVQDAHYAVVGAALLATLEAGLQEAFTPAVRQAWVDVYGVIATTMQQAPELPSPVEATPLA